MSADGSQAAETEALSRKVEAIERETAALVNTLGRARNTRLCLFFVVLVMVVIICVAFYRLGNQFKSKENMDLLMETASNQLGLRSDRFFDEIKALVDHSTPVLREALAAQMTKDMDKYEEGLDRERAVLLENLQEQLEKKVQEHQHKILTQHESILKEEFPQFEDKQSHTRMIDNIQIAMTPLIRKFYVDRLRDQLEGMYEIWDQFPVADPVEKGDPPLDVVLAGQLLELLTIKLTARPEREAIEEKMRTQPATQEKGGTQGKKKDEPTGKKKDESKGGKKNQPEEKKKSQPEEKKNDKADTAKKP